MSEEEIIKEVKGYLDFENGIGIKAIQGLLDLYQKEKEKNKNWEKIYDEDQQHITNLNNRIFDLEADNKKLDKENQGLFELYNFNDTSLLAKILKDYRKEIKKLTPSSTNPIPLEKQTNIWVNKKDYISKDTIREIANKRNKNNEDYKKAYFEILELLEERN